MPVSKTEGKHEKNRGKRKEKELKWLLWKKKYTTTVHNRLFLEDELFTFKKKKKKRQKSGENAKVELAAKN